MLLDGEKFTIMFELLLWSKNFLFDIFSIPDVDALIIMVTNEAQAESVLYGDYGAVSGILKLSAYHFRF